MTKQKKIFSLLMAASMLTSIPTTGKAHASDDDWSLPSPCYNSKGELVYNNICTYITEPVITLPTEYKGIPIVSVNPVNFIESWMGAHDWYTEIPDDLTVYVPEGIELVNSYSEDPYSHFYPSRDWGENFNASFILSSGEVREYHLRQYTEPFEEVYDPELDEYVRVDKTIDQLWDYEEFTDENGEKGIRILRSKGRTEIIRCPDQINGLPVKSIGTKLFGDEEYRMEMSIIIPDSVTEFQKDCFYGQHNLNITYRDCNYTLVHDDDPETSDYLVLKRIGFGTLYTEVEDECNRNGIYDHKKIADHMYEKVKEKYVDNNEVICDKIADYPLIGLFGSDDYSVCPSYVPIPDSIKFIRKGSLAGSDIRFIKLPKELKVLPSELLRYDEEQPAEIVGLENVKYMPRDFYKGRDYDGDEKLYLTDGMLPEGTSVDDPFTGFHVNDEKGRTYRIIMDKKDFNYYAHLIYEPEDLGEVPEEFMGFPVIDERSDTLYPFSSIVTIPEDMKEIGLLDFYFDPMDFPQLKKPMTLADYKNYETAIKSRMGYCPLSNLKKLNILSKDITIKESTFKNCKLDGVEFKGDAFIGNGAFNSSEINGNISFTGNMPSITLDSGAFYRAKLKGISFPEKVKDLRIEMNALSGITAEKIVLPEGTSYIGDSSFANCQNLKDVTINGNPEIVEYAFTNCHNLENVTISGNPKVGDDIFRNCDSLKNININCSEKHYGHLVMSCPALETLNGEDPFDKNGFLKEKYADFIEHCMKYSCNNVISDKYVMYRVKKMVSETVTDDMTDMEKMKALHDKLCRMVVYDSENEGDPKNHTDISVFLNDSSVCEGYARGFNLLLHEAGIESCYVINKTHAWNIVKLGGHYFHIDPTWNDDDDVGTGISYDWFLKTDDEIKGDDSHRTWQINKPSSLHDFQWSKLPQCDEKMGDVNSDGIVDGKDATAVLSSYAKASAGDELTIDAVLGDVNFNGRIDAVDASTILTQYADSSAKGV